MKSIFRRTCGFIAAGVIGMGVLCAPPIAGRALAIGPNLPYMDPNQEADAPPTAWLLMAPPTTTSGLTVDTQAGLANWITYGRYNTLQDCSETIQIVRNGVIPTTGLPMQASNGAISPGSVPIPGAMQMPTPYPGAQPGYGTSPGGPPPMQPGYPPGPPGYPPPPQGSPMGQPGYPGTQPAPSGYAGAQPGYPGAQPGYPGAQPGYPGAQPGYPGMQPGAPGMQRGYGVNQPPQAMIQQPAQYMTRQQADEAYCFANNDRRLIGLVAPPPPPGRQQLNGLTGGEGQGFPGSGQ